MMTKKEQKRLVSCIDRFARTRILVVGDIVLDHYIWGKVSRISPEAPVPVVNVTRESLLLGGATNVVQNIHALGGSVSICGVIGSDEAGSQVLRLLRGRGIQTDGLIETDDRPTTIKTRIIAHSQQVVRFDRETRDGIGKEVHNRIFDHVKRRVAEGLDGIVVSDYSKGVVTADLVRDIVRISRKSGIIVSVDPKVHHFGMYRGVTILTPNVNEASIGSRIEICDENSLLRAGALLLRKLNCDAVLITRGEQGMSLFERGGRVTHIPTVAREVFDVTGAGDTVIGALTLSMASGAGMVDAARISNYAAGIVVGIVGTASVKPEELKQKIVQSS
ncbi:MAG TPA: D-glycero-beta-D-manno-heptose-7-phosphate kinase [Nitrospirota bacterium]|nr:D-glycero-beta-D-manno-heptose-7-phosphate kinase [Nitrospirota bacterium]